MSSGRQLPKLLGGKAAYEMTSEQWEAKAIVAIIAAPWSKLNAFSLWLSALCQLVSANIFVGSILLMVQCTY